MRHAILSAYLRSRRGRIERIRHQAVEQQRRILSYLLKKGSATAFGKEHGFSPRMSYEDFSGKVPVRRYEDFHPYIERTLRGEAAVVWPQRIRYFSKSSGTTNAQSKYIPISDESLRGNHFLAAYDLVTAYLCNHPDARMFSGRALRLGGSLQSTENGMLVGDLSAILMSRTPKWADRCSTPDRETSLLADWNEKLPRMVDQVIRRDVTSLAGVPSWMLVMLEKVLEVTGASDLCQVWPHLELFMHGGIAFTPYQEIYRRLIPSSRMRYYEVYNASEGFFAFQDTAQSKDMLLMSAHGIFYEFIPMDQFLKKGQAAAAVPLWEVRMDTPYAMVITTCGGLWRYLIGDTVRFTSLDPYRLVITGRTKQFINAFGEEVVVENAEQALDYACGCTGAHIREYTAAPVFMERGSKGAHEWIVEFDTPPDDRERFVEALDSRLQAINSDYRAKRYSDITLRRPVLTVAPEGLFYRWMALRGKMGGQNKVPRLENSRQYADALRELMDGMKKDGSVGEATFPK